MSSELDFENVEFSTPMMQQYLQVKKQYQDCIVWFRLGDFYEMFLDDAVTGSRILGITLTSRARGKDGRIPMCGVPYHAADQYLSKLVKAGHKVAICEQVTEPDGKNLVEREVIRVITPGTLLDEKSLERKQNNYVLCVSLKNQIVGAAAVDLLTREFLAGEVRLDADKTFFQVLSELHACLQPAEILLSPSCPAVDAFKTSTLKEWKLYIQFPSKKLAQTGEIAPTTLETAAALISYLQYTQKTDTLRLQSIQPIWQENYLKMNRSTIQNLELFATLHEGHRHHSFLQTIDHTLTAMGGRLLRQWILKPLTDQEAIEERLDSVAFFVQKRTAREELRSILKEVIDVERLLGRLNLGISNPRDLKNLAHALDAMLHITYVSKRSQSPFLFDGHSISIAQQIIDLINRTLSELPPIDPHKGGFILEGIDQELDTWRHTASKSRTWIVELETTERKKTGITSLKIKFNQVFGFYIEVSNANLTHVPSYFVRKQTLVNAERFSTPELKKHEEIILAANAESEKREYDLFQKLVAHVLETLHPLQSLIKQAAELDCLLNFAHLAEYAHYSRPTLTASGELNIKNGRHPVIEHITKDQQFVPNDVTLSTKNPQLLLITGPNMAGKSVFMRQVALITLMAHLGSFVPADVAQITITDQIFVRSGAADMITAGLSTFMVEMVETAHILRHATVKSLVIMDEIGRGTSTYDGISIAWAIAEELVKERKFGPKTLFATHYHELQALADKWPGKIANFHMAIAEHQGKPVFLYKLREGGASHSFGLAVAQLAGIPEPVIERAKTLLKKLEK